MKAKKEIAKKDAELRARPLVAALKVFAYGITGIGVLDDYALREVAADVSEWHSDRQLALAIINARAALAEWRKGKKS